MGTGQERQVRLNGMGAAVAGEARFCAHCGARLSPGARFCSRCGKAQVPAPASTAPQPVPVPHPQPAPKPEPPAWGPFNIRLFGYRLPAPAASLYLIAVLLAAEVVFVHVYWMIRDWIDTPHHLPTVVETNRESPRAPLPEPVKPRKRRSPTATFAPSRLPSAASPATEASAPAIASFSLSRSTIERGQSAELTWSVTGADVVTLEPGGGRFSYGTGRSKVTPSETTTYHLTAKNALGSTERSITLQVIQPDVPGPNPAQSEEAPLPNTPPQRSNLLAAPEPSADTPPGKAGAPTATGHTTVTVQTRTGDQTGELFWTGVVRGSQLVSIRDGRPNVGSLVGRLPGVPCTAEAEDAAHVAILDPPGPQNNYRNLLIKVTGNGAFRVAVRWTKTH